MKLKDKLALEYALEKSGMRTEFALVASGGLQVKHAWIAGFEKAREMALMPEHGYEGPFISGASIEELGEEEV